MSKKNKKIAPDAIQAPTKLRILLPILTVLILLVLALFWLLSEIFMPISSPPPTTIAAASTASPIANTQETNNKKPQQNAQWVDEQQCQGCHAEQATQWQGSHHHLAMQETNEKTVLGDFNNVTFKDDKEPSHFYRKDNSYWVNAVGSDGKKADFKVAYTFGIEPLQQYLLELPGGHLQPFNVAWDTQKQRWFHLYPNQKMDFNDPLHWSKTAQNANFMCVECHTNGFKRNFDADKNVFNSHWQALGVGCQSCHGDASTHVQWANNHDLKNTSQQNTSQENITGKGFTKSLVGGNSVAQVETCAQCHALRSSLDDGRQSAHAFIDDYLPSLLTEPMYEVNGQIKGEVFEYGSFTQSKMFAAGVQCSDCHNPHSGKIRAEGNALCMQCHNPAAKPIRPEINAAGLRKTDYNSIEHTHHAQDSKAAQCVSCHMPGKLYMGNDYRHDHSFSTPNPMQALALKTPDACLTCHNNQSKQTAVIDAFKQWYPQAKVRDGGYAAALKLARDGGDGAAKALQEQLARNDLPAIRHATLLSEAPDYPSSNIAALIVAALQDTSPQVRGSAINAVAASMNPQQQAQLLIPLLDDSARAVRLETVLPLAQLPAELRQGISEKKWQQALQEYEQVQIALGNRGEGNLNRATLYQLTNRQADIEPALRAALLRDPDFLPALVSLAQWLEQQGKKSEAEKMLLQAMAKHPQDAILPYTYGMHLIRQDKKDLALVELKKAATLEPDNPQYGYLYAIALHDTGDATAARDYLKLMLQRQPENRAARMALFNYANEVHDMALMQQLLEELYQINPDDPALQKN